MVDGLIHVLATGPPAADAGAEIVRSTWILFSIISGLLILFVLVVAGIAMLRRHRRESSRQRADETAGVDAWSEAGRRVDGIASGEDAADR